MAVVEAMPRASTTIARLVNPGALPNNRKAKRASRSSPAIVVVPWPAHHSSGPGPARCAGSWVAAAREGTATHAAHSKTLQRPADQLVSVLDQQQARRERGVGPDGRIRDGVAANLLELRGVRPRDDQL